MTPRLTSTLAAFALSGSLALAQQPPATPTATVTAPAADSAAPAAPIERQPPSDQADPSAQPNPHHMHPNGMHPGMRPDQDGQPNFRASMQERNNFRQGPGSFREHQFHRENADFHPGSRGAWWKNPMLAQRLTLTPEQTQKLDTISQQARLHLIDLRANLERQQAILEPLLTANPVDTTRALAQVDKVAEAHAALEESQAKTALTLRAVLTPDQWTKLTDRRTPNQFGPGAQDNTPGHPAEGQGGRPHWRRNAGPAPTTSNLTSPIDATDQQ
jgi:Spy/CpxP family protein refolding chaperone